MSIETYADHLIAQANQHWARGEPCPVDIITKLYAEGIDAANLEDQFDADATEDEEALLDNPINYEAEEETHG